MLKVTLKSILGHKSRLVSTALAIILGVAFVAGTFVFTDTVQAAFDDLFATIGEKTSAQVRSSSVVETQFGDERGNIPESALAQVEAIDGVASAVGLVEGFAVMIDSEGEPIGANNGPPRFGFNWIEDESLSQWHLIDGTAPSGESEVTIDAGSAKVADIEVGDGLTVMTVEGPIEFDVAGIAQFGTVDSAGGSTVALFDTPTAQRYLGAVGEFSAVEVRAEPGVTEDEVVSNIESGLDSSNFDVISGTDLIEENQTEIRDAFSFFTIFLLVFALIALFVGSFVIYNTFAIIVAQRTKEMALLRALGASRRQVRASVLLEAIVIGTIASVVGIFVGILIAVGMKAGMGAVGIDLPPGPIEILPRTLVVGLIAGLAVTMFASLSPALKASRIPPIQALREAAIDSEGGSRIRFVIGSVVTALGIGLLLFGLLSPVLPMVGLGAALLFVGLLGLGPVIAPPFVRFISKPLPRYKGVVGTLARDNSMRNPTRTSRTAAALLVGVALVSATTVLASSLKASVEDIFEQSFVGDVAIDSGSFDPSSGLSPKLTADLNKLPEVDVATGLRWLYAEFDGEGGQVTAVDPETALQVFDVGLVAPATASDLGMNEIFLYSEYALDNDYKVGDTIEAQFPSAKKELTVSGLYTKNELAGDFAVSQALTNEVYAQQFDIQSFILLADGVDLAEALDAIEAVADDYPGANVQDKQEFIDNQSKSIDGLVNMIYGLLGMAVLIAVFGIANTLRLSVLERTREIGLLRAVGMTRKQIRSVIRWEAAITALLGAVQGVIVGIALGYAVIYALRSQGINKFSVPSVSILVIVVAAGFFGVLAARKPAKRAANMDVLEAITHD